MRPYRLHVLFEHGPDGIPYSHSHVRLLRPLSHPSLRPWVRMTAGPELCEGQVDVVVVDRLWRPDVSLEVASELVEEIRSQKEYGEPDRSHENPSRCERCGFRFDCDQRL